MSSSTVKPTPLIRTTTTRDSLADSLWGIRCVWLRYFDVFRKSIFYSLITTFAEPILALLSFGFGLGVIIGELKVQGHTLSYRQFVLAGVAAQSILFQGFFEASYGGFVRMYYQKIFKAMSVTPVTLSEVIWGELLWDSTKSVLSGAVVFLLGAALGDFSIKGALICIPLAFLFGLLFSALGLLVAARSKTIEQISYPQYLFVFPMFMFCGVFYPVETLPQIVQSLAWFLPLTGVISIIRTLCLDLPFHYLAIPNVIIWLIGLVWASRYFMMRRLAL